MLAVRVRRTRGRRHLSDPGRLQHGRQVRYSGHVDVPDDEPDLQVLLRRERMGRSRRCYLEGKQSHRIYGRQTPFQRSAAFCHVVQNWLLPATLLTMQNAANVYRI